MVQLLSRRSIVIAHAQPLSTLAGLYSLIYALYLFRFAMLYVASTARGLIAPHLRKLYKTTLLCSEVVRFPRQIIRFFSCPPRNAD